jgi:hypothetical protein
MISAVIGTGYTVPTVLAETSSFELLSTASAGIQRIVYQIRRPLGLAFAISFVGWENCCRSIFR